MNKEKYIAVFLLCAALGIAAYFYMSGGSYPMAIVGGNIITKNEFAKNYSAHYNYYYAAAKTYGGIKEFATEEAVLEIKRATLEQLILNILVRGEVKTRLGDSYNSVLGNKIKIADANPDFQAAATAIYGISFNEFEEKILTPMADLEILEGQLFAEGQSLDEWLKIAKENAQVIILDSAFSWSKNGVELR